MMQPSHPPPSPPSDTSYSTSSIFEAIKNDDWEGLLKLYATTVYDAVHSAHFENDSRRQYDVSFPGTFREETKTDGVHHHLSSSFLEWGNRSHSSSIRELDLLVREMVGGELRDEDDMLDPVSQADQNIFAMGEATNAHRYTGEAQDTTPKATSPTPSLLLEGRQQLNKKTRQQRQQCSSVRQTSLPPPKKSSASESHTTDNHYSSSDSRRLGDISPRDQQEAMLDEWEQVMWESAAVLSNIPPSPSFVAHRQDRDRRDVRREVAEKGACGGKDTSLEQQWNQAMYGGYDDEKHWNGVTKSIGDVTAATSTGNQAATTKEETTCNVASTDTNLIFEGHVAIATPTHHHSNALLLPRSVPPPPSLPGGFGTALHLACTLDSPFALGLLLALGVDPGACHTAFRRLAVHEAACADAPLCLQLLLELGSQCMSELCEEEEERIGTDSTKAATAEACGSENTPLSSCLSTSYSPSSSLNILRGRLSPSLGLSTSFPSSSGYDFLREVNDSFSRDVGEKGTNNRSCYRAHPAHGQTKHRGGGKKSNLKKLNPFSGWHRKSIHHRSTDVGGDNVTPKMSAATIEFMSFPAALRIMWGAVKLLRSGLMNEMDAAHYLLDRIRLPNRVRSALALQCPHFSPSNAKMLQQESSDGDPKFHYLHTSANNDVNNDPLFNLSSTPLSSSTLSQEQNIDGHGNTPLHWAAFKNSLRAMEVLLSQVSVDVNRRAHPSGWTPLHDAAYSDADGAVRLLVAAGARVDVRSRSGATPLCFAAQEDAPKAARALLRAGADLAVRCCGSGATGVIEYRGRFSGYTPLHYCAHYDSWRAARVLLFESTERDGGGDNSGIHPYNHINLHQHCKPLSPSYLLEIPDLNDKLPIHVAVARGSSRVLRELLHGGARVEIKTTVSRSLQSSPRGANEVGSRGTRNDTAEVVAETVTTVSRESAPMAIPRRRNERSSSNANNAWTRDGGISTTPTPLTVVTTPVSSPVLRSMIPSQPITSSKPWNCLSQKSINACRHLIEEVEMNWTPERHVLFVPADRASVMEVLRVGKRMEQVGRGIFLDLWPRVLSFCGRGWFEPLERGGQYMVEETGEVLEGKVPFNGSNNKEEIPIQCSSTTSFENLSRGEDTEEEFTQFQLEDADDGMSAVI